MTPIEPPALGAPSRGRAPVVIADHAGASLPA